MNFKPVPSSEKSGGPGLAVMFLLLVLVVTVLLGGAFLPGRTLFSNDGPLGRLMSECHKLPAAFTGVWEDLNSVGYLEQGALPSITYGLRLLLHPVLFSKFYAAVAIVILGLGAWCFFRQLKLAPAACLLGGLAAALNSDFFSDACWGIAAHAITVGMAFFAMAALLKTSSWRSWIYVLLAGAAVGMGLEEGADVGAIFSVFVAAFAMYQAWIADGPRVKNLTLGAGRVALVAGFSAFVAAQAIFALVHTQIEGVSGMSQDQQTKEERWLWVTRWSLPKCEALGEIVPGLFGYRLDTPHGGYYWGSLGRSKAWDDYLANGQMGPKPVDILRQTGSGIYTGVAVVVVAFWAVFQSFRRKESVFNPTQRKWIWFWLGVSLISLLLGFGRHAPFYRLVYALPYSSTIRNPVKFISVMNFALVILFAYGVDGLWRTYLGTGRQGALRRSPLLIQFDQLWVRGCLVTLGLSVIAWIIYANCHDSLRVYLEMQQFSPVHAREIADFSIWQVGWFVLFFILVAGLMWLMTQGHFAGKQARWGAILLGVVMVMDLGRANLPWIISWDYHQRYASNPVLDVLRDKPYEHRVAVLPFHASNTSSALEALYRYEWAQHQFQYYDIQSYDLVQLPRAPEDMDAFRKATVFDGSPASRALLLRRWQLTNTRYLLGSMGPVEQLNAELDPLHPHQFRVVTRFKLTRKDQGPNPPQYEDITAQLSPSGEYALYEFTDAMPRAKLFPTWQTNNDLPASLKLILNPAFNPDRDLLLDSPLPTNATQSTNQDAGTVEFVSYASRDVVLSAKASSSCILLLNDRYDPTWKVTVDGKPAPLLRCNYFMRGVYLEPGTHKVEFRFDPPVGALHVSLAAMAVTLLLVGICVAARPREAGQTIRKPSSLEEQNKVPDNANKDKTPEPTASAKHSKPEPKRKSKQSAGKGGR